MPSFSMQSKEIISMQQFEMCDLHLPKAMAQRMCGSLQMLHMHATSHWAGWVAGWEASQETTAPANDSVGGSDSSESEPSP